MKDQKSVLFEGPGYIHKKTGASYSVLQVCSIKIDDYWVDGVVYVGNGKMYARFKSDFEDKFEAPERK